jgi:hypothetical protein
LTIEPTRAIQTHNNSEVYMRHRDFLHSSVLAAAATAANLRSAYAAVATDKTVADVSAVNGDGNPVTLRGAEIREGRVLRRRCSSR